MPGVVTIDKSTFICHFYINPEKREVFLQEFDQLWRRSLDFMNENCNFVFYGFGRDDNEMVAIESYKNEDILAELRSTPDFQETVGNLLVYCDRPMLLEIYRGLDNDRQVFEIYPKGPSVFHPRFSGAGGFFA